mmetsp:Transcript_20538/g.61237  ORF Transcript_20538/g.61237 Transcript_20538/m.61237 type:complete len:85 (-) Transcript_20538:610-864(-)
MQPSSHCMICHALRYRLAHRSWKKLAFGNAQSSVKPHVSHDHKVRVNVLAQAVLEAGQLPSFLQHAHPLLQNLILPPKMCICFF